MSARPVDSPSDRPRRGRTWTFAGVPSWRDARWGQIVALTTFCILGQTVLDFAITPLEILLVVGTTTALDWALTRVHRHQVIVPLSGVISGLGLALLLRSHYPAVFVVAGLLAIGSKHFIVIHGRHRFNPSNFGLVVTLAFTQGGISMVTPGQWGRSGLTLFAIMGAGVLVVSRARRMSLVAMFVAAQVVCYAVAHGGDPRLTVSLSGAVLAFAFFMITDPKTAPTSWRGQVAYAVTIAGGGQILTRLGSGAGPFIALLAVCAAMPAVERLAARGGWRALLPRQGLAPST